MQRYSFFTKLFLGNLLLVGVIVTITGIVSYRYLDANYQRDVEGEQSRTARRMQRYFKQIWSWDEGVIEAECKTLFRDASMRLTVIAADGLVLGDSRADPATMENHKTEDRVEVLAALEGRSGRHVRTSETTGVEYRYFAEPIDRDGRVVGVVRIAMPVRAMAEGSGLIKSSLIWSALTGGLVAAVLGLLLSWMWYSPLRRITHTAREIASGDIECRVDMGGSRELAQLGEALNDMASSLANEIRKVDIQRGNLETVVKNLREGVVALDGEGRVVVMNAFAHEILGVMEDNTAGRQLQEVVRVADVVEAFRQTVDSGESVRTQVEWGTTDLRKTLDLLTITIAEPSSEGIRFLLVVRDITEQAQVAKMKSEFAANASHELRTPLAVIRTAIDSLNGLGPEDSDELEKIRRVLDRHSERLVEMTNDLLNLHMIETAKQQLRLEEMHVGLLAEWVEDHYLQQAEDKGVALEVFTENSLAMFTSDVTLLQLILQNLIDNAIKFTPESGQVRCVLTAHEDLLLLRVSDTGCGIPPELQDRVFERFFQVEPSRSGASKARGTGLGLAIVKHATERLRGRITLESEVGNGTRIEIKLPNTPGADQ